MPSRRGASANFGSQTSSQLPYNVPEALDCASAGCPIVVFVGYGQTGMMKERSPEVQVFAGVYGGGGRGGSADARSTPSQIIGCPPFEDPRPTARMGLYADESGQCALGARKARELDGTAGGGGRRLPGGAAGTPRARVPLRWAGTQMKLGNALSAPGNRESGTARLGGGGRRLPGGTGGKDPRACRSTGPRRRTISALRSGRSGSPRGCSCCRW